MYRDPELSRVGLQRCVQRGPLFQALLKKLGWKTYVLAASSLFRAQSTAYHMIATFRSPVRNQRTVHVFPHIAEKGLTLDNVPLSRQAQQDALRKLDPKTLQSLRGGLDYRAHEGMMTKSDWHAFRSWLGRKLPELVRLVPRTTGPLRIVIVTHHHFVKHTFGISLENCGAILVKLRWHEDGTVTQTGPASELQYCPKSILLKDLSLSDVCPDGCRLSVCV